MQKNGYEAGIGENPGPMCKDNHDKSVTNFIDIIKVARAQHILLKSMCIEESKCNPPPDNVQQALKSVVIPFFHVIGLKIRFYILFQISGDLYGFFEWAVQDFPKNDTNIFDTIFLSKKFLIFRVCIKYFFSYFFFSYPNSVFF